jgi:L-asparaginase
MRSRKPRIAIVTLGGTIASAAAGAPGVTPTVTGLELVAAVPELGSADEIELVAFRQLPSAELGIGDLIELAGVVRAQLDDGCVGAVVVQGTDTLEESAFALDLLVPNAEPVVVTGAMRHPAAAGADGAANLLAAAAVARADSARDAGCLVVMNDEIHSARHVAKRHTQSPAAFRSSTVGPIGWLSEGTPRIALRPLGRATLAMPQHVADAPVALLAMAPGEDEPLLAAVPALGYRGLVLETLGGGHVPSASLGRVAAVTQDLPVVFASRTSAGDVLQSTYGFAGSEADLIACGAIAAGLLDGPKARVLLRLLIGAGATRDEIADAFARLSELGETPVDLLPVRGAVA